MFSSEKRDLRESNVYKMMEQLGIESGDGVIPKFGLSFCAALRNCKNCKSVAACNTWLDTPPHSAAPEFCGNADIFFELTIDGQTVPRSMAAH